MRSRQSRRTSRERDDRRQARTAAKPLPRRAGAFTPVMLAGAAVRGMTVCRKRMREAICHGGMARSATRSVVIAMQCWLLPPQTISHECGRRGGLPEAKRNAIDHRWGVWFIAGNGTEGKLPRWGV
ncbi:MAG: hypothetical protein KDD67_03245 [Ignavibacteriae bacterium]|nr:hypothetical protein [Ignavibacteriota bacterium]MCB9217153.1 hypothetical protein [Ignavibacteria bacterium]